MNIKKIGFSLFFIFIPLFLLAQADLAVMSLKADPEKPVPGEEVTLILTILNVSEFDFKGEFVVKIVIDENIIFEQKISNLQSNKESLFEVKWQAVEGDHSIVALIDPGSEMERNPINNIDTIQILVLEPEKREELEKKTELANFPDLVCKELARPPRAELQYGNIVTFIAVFINTTKINVDEPVKAIWEMNDTKIAETTLEKFPANMQLNLRMKWRATTGKYRFVAIIDPDNKIKEQVEEDNNKCELQFTIHPPEIYKQVPDSPFKIRNFSYIAEAEVDQTNQLYIEEVAVNPELEFEAALENLYNVTFVVHNPTTSIYENITVTVKGENMFARSFIIDKLNPDERKEISFKDSISRGKVSFQIFYEKKITKQDGFFMPQDFIEIESTKDE